MSNNNHVIIRFTLRGEVHELENQLTGDDQAVAAKLRNFLKATEKIFRELGYE